MFNFEKEPEAAEHLVEILKDRDFCSLYPLNYGLDTVAVKAFFAEFINRPGITAPQMIFMDTLINYLTNNGTIDRSMLFDWLFTDINQQGASDAFKDEDMVEIISIIDRYGCKQSLNIA